MNEQAEEAVDIREYLRPLWQRRWLIIALTVFVATAAYTVSNRKARVYASATSVYLQQSQDAGLFPANGVTFDPRLAQDQARLLQSGQTAAEVKRILRSQESPGALRARVSIAAEPQTNFITISAVGPTPAETADLANAYAQAFVTSRSENVQNQLRTFRKQAQAELDSLKGTSQAVLDQRSLLRSRVRQLSSALLTPDGGATQVDVATPNSTPITPHPRRNAIYAALLALLAGGLGALFYQRVDRRVRTSADLEELYGTNVLASVPHVVSPSPVVDGAPAISDGLREAMRTLRVGISLQTLSDPARVLVVSSAIQAEGKSTVARNLALAFVEAGSRVVVVEADLRRPTVAASLGVREDVGLTDFLVGSATLEDALVDADASAIHSDATLSVLPAGSETSNPPAVLGSARMADLVNLLLVQYDFVVIDSPPLLAVSDTLVLLPASHGVILVGRVGLSSRDSIHRVTDVIERAPGGRILGLVVNDADLGTYGYGYGYGKGTKPSANEPDVLGTPRVG
jgi:capsular exopolysaccharide synthesis family protein